MAGDGGGHVEGEDRVTAFGGAVLQNVFPFFLVSIFLIFGPRLARGVVDGLRIGGPGEGVDVFFSFGDGEGFAAAGRDEIDMADFVFGVGIGVVALPCWVLAFREEGDPLAVGGPLGVGVVSGLRERNQRAGFAVVLVEPEIGAENLLVPIGAFGDDDHRIAIGREFDGMEAD